MKKIKSLHISIIIVSLYGLLSLFFITGSWFFLHANKYHNSSLWIVIFIIAVTYISLTLMITMLLIKFKKLSIDIIEKYIFRKSRHERLFLGKKTKVSKGSFLKLKIIFFYFFYIKPIFSVFGLSILLFTSTNLGNNFWIIYVIIAWNQILIIIALVKLFNFSPLKIMAESQFYEFLYQSKDDVYANQKINFENVKLNYDNRKINSEPKSSIDLLTAELFSIEHEDLNNKNE